MSPHAEIFLPSVLVPDSATLDTNSLDAIHLFVVDWEFAQFGHRAYDIGQMIGDLYERKHFRNVDAAIWTLEGFVDGYGAMNDDMAFRTAIHAGVQLICWYIRRDPKSPLPCPYEQAAVAIKLGTEFVAKGWEKDKTWFKGTVLAGLFRE